ncbi:MAG: enoyl-CoA hydratase [SAR86 cluster bacterium]|uniref:Enoyl-CoA hydratase n=1 Tax=SAR86 cluster bacterium TaxID=2030880 RepID=A0A2A4X0F2_9GAMM|nr:MAG: enoyl-CoA hydratase [SAR86 cluster bacterium]
MTSLVEYQFVESVSTITLNDGKANAISPAMLAELNAALDKAESDAGVVVIRGREGLFSGGFDLSVFKSGDQREILSMLQGGAELAERLLGFPQPTIAACNGHAMAMGLFILLSCDLRIGIDAGHRFGANEVAIGLTVPRFATTVCRHRLTPAAFNCGLVLAQPFESSNAVNAGILDVTVTPDQFEKTVMGKAVACNSLDIKSHRATKQRARAGLLSELRTSIELDCEDWSQRI